MVFALFDIIKNSIFLPVAYVPILEIKNEISLYVLILFLSLWYYSQFLCLDDKNENERIKAKKREREKNIAKGSEYFYLIIII